MAITNIQKFQTVTLPNDGTYTYVNLFENETSDKYDAPRTILLANTSVNFNVAFVLLTESDDTADVVADDGYFLKSEGQIEIKTGSPIKHHRIGLKIIGIGGASEEVVLSRTDFVSVYKESTAP